MLTISILTSAITCLTLLFLKGRAGSVMATAAVLINACASSWLAIRVLAGEPMELVIRAGQVFGEIPLRIDALSAWFILVMNLTVATGILYGASYLVPYRTETSTLTLHYTAYIWNHLSMLGIYIVQNTLAFLCAWEIMAITSFVLVIFEHTKVKTLKAGMNFLIQSHLCIVFLTLGILWVSSSTGSYDFNAIGAYSASVKSPVSFALFTCFFIAFGFKAGFVPFHTWLPHAHPAAPAHVSGVMSGVIIKLGIFGILRMLLLIRENQLLIGYCILGLSIITGIYGVMLAIIQHNLKKLLAYHSIENIGIIGAGIGLGAIGLGSQNPFLAFAGFGGALLHTFNHSLFKSLLFYCAGTVYQATHSLNLEKLGGLIKTMPQTAALFLVGAVAISGLPPLNGFVSEFYLYSGLFNDLRSLSLGHTVMLIIAISSLAIIGGMAMLCFTKAFSIGFLGVNRHGLRDEPREKGFARFLPKYVIVAFMLAIGLLPHASAAIVSKPVALFAINAAPIAPPPSFAGTLQHAGTLAGVFILITVLVLWLRNLAIAKRTTALAPTWACGYLPASAHRLQYTANSFARSYRKLVRPLLMMNKREGTIHGLFPTPIHSETSPYDKLEAILVDAPTRFIKGFMGRFRVLQNGSVQFYVLYGVVFIFIFIAIPLMIEAVGVVAD
ncbi:MAG TPA: proton-conducting transporter membrane subunit, partial [Chryseosolibacter sp.]